MFFTWLSTIIAWIALVVGGLRLATGLFVAINLDSPGFDPGRYLTVTSGESINQGLVVIVFAVGLGIISKSSRAFLKRRA